MPRATWNGAVIAEAGSAACQTVEGNTYFPPDAVNRKYLRPSTTRTECPWKGTARYFDVVVDGQVNKDAAWSYPEATDAAKRIESYVSFWKGVGIEPWTGGDDAAASLSPGSGSAAAGPLRAGSGSGSGSTDFRLADARGGEVSLADVLSKRRAVLVFYRGGWCPICNSQLAALSARYEDFRRRDLEILAISNEEVREGRKLLAKLGPPFPLLLDSSSAVIRRFDLRVDRRDPLGWVLGKHDYAHPAVVLVGRDGAVDWSYLGRSYRDRPTPDRILEAADRTANQSNVDRVIERRG